MEINGKPRIVVWFVSNDTRFISHAINILGNQFNGIDIVGVTANNKIEINDNQGRAVPFIPLQELANNGGGGTMFFLLPVRRNAVCRKLRNLHVRLISTPINFWAIGLFAYRDLLLKNIGNCEGRGFPFSP